MITEGKEVLVVIDSLNDEFAIIGCFQALSISKNCLLGLEPTITVCASKSPSNSNVSNVYLEIGLFHF